MNSTVPALRYCTALANFTACSGYSDAENKAFAEQFDNEVVANALDLFDNTAFKPADGQPMIEEAFVRVTLA